MSQFQSPAPAAAAGPAQQGRGWAGASVLIGQVVIGIALLLFWQLAWTGGWVDPIIARSPEQVWSALLMLIGDGTLWPSFYATMEATLMAFVLASVVGVLVGIGLGLFPRVEELFDPYINAINTMPRIAFAPVFTLYFGIGQEAKIALAFSIVVFMVMIAARAGIQNVDRDVVTMARLMGTSRSQMFTKILLPAATPSIFAGLKLGVVYSLFGVITSEILSSRIGLGHLISRFAAVFQLEGMYAVILIMTVAAAALNGLMTVIERRFLKWSEFDDQ
ncbi:ABC transporter permease [Devosia sp. YIM 151766]|uniref:ABC transporter permease n=1 Tax=Devosia sp. YIM 151766 TaxID=3017325 RepID=UPI00255C68BF|nr:ABC transporter permease [Devosia sp. YIM 151766]WIY53904.1 ABC transporter permease [Devosia sp. YIM 151766]